MKCTNCGAELPQNFTFCTQCGSPVGEGSNASAPFAQQSPAAAQPANPYPPQPPRQPVPGMQYGQPAPGVPGIPPQGMGMGMMPQPKSPFVKGAWFAPVSVVVYFVFAILQTSVLPLITRYNNQIYSLVNSIVGVAVSLVFIGAAIGLYFAAHTKADPLQRKARFAVVFVPIAIMKLLEGCSGVISSILFTFVNSGALRVQVYAISTGVVRFLMFIAGALVSYFIVRALQKALDKAFAKKG